MSLQAELEPKPNLPEGITEIPEVPEIPQPLREEMKAVQTQVTAQVADDSGNPLIQTPATSQVTITLPADPVTLQSYTKGSPVSALTWLAVFWLRAFKKAVHLGWKVVVKGGNTENA